MLFLLFVRDEFPEFFTLPGEHAGIAFAEGIKIVPVHVKFDRFAKVRMESDVIYITVSAAQIGGICFRVLNKDGCMVCEYRCVAVFVCPVFQNDEADDAKTNGGDQSNPE